MPAPPAVRPANSQKQTTRINARAASLAYRQASRRSLVARGHLQKQTLMEAEKHLGGGDHTHPYQPLQIYIELHIT